MKFVKTLVQFLGALEETTSPLLNIRRFFYFNTLSGILSKRVGEGIVLYFFNVFLVKYILVFNGIQS